MGKANKMRIKAFLLSMMIVIVIFSCKKSLSEKQSNYQFYIEKVGIHITTSKHLGDKFYVIFRSDDSLGTISKNTDYVEFETGHTPINIIFDLSNKRNIYVLNEFNVVKTYNSNYYHIKFVDINDFESSFFEPQYKTEPLRIKPSYISLYIESMLYSIGLNSEFIKKGDAYGGW